MSRPKTVQPGRMFSRRQLDGLGDVQDLGGWGRERCGLGRDLGRSGKVLGSRRHERGCDTRSTVATANAKRAIEVAGTAIFTRGLLLALVLNGECPHGRRGREEEQG